MNAHVCAKNTITSVGCCGSNFHQVLCMWDAPGEMDHEDIPRESFCCYTEKKRQYTDFFHGCLLHLHCTLALITKCNTCGMIRPSVLGLSVCDHNTVRNVIIGQPHQREITLVLGGGPVLSDCWEMMTHGVFYTLVFVTNHTLLVKKGFRRQWMPVKGMKKHC